MHVNILWLFLIDPGWGILSHPAVVKRGGQWGSKGKGGGEVELGGAVCLGGGSLFPWFPQVTSPTMQTYEINREIHRQSKTKTER